MKNLQRILLCICAVCAFSISFADNAALPTTPGTYVARSFETGTVPIVAAPTVVQTTVPTTFTTGGIINPTIYYNMKIKAYGLVNLTKIDTFKRLALDLSMLYGAESAFKSVNLSDFTGVAGVSLTHTFVLDTNLKALIGAAITWDSGQQPSGGVVGGVSLSF